MDENNQILSTGEIAHNGNDKNYISFDLFFRDQILNNIM